MRSALIAVAVAAAAGCGPAPDDGQVSPARTLPALPALPTVAPAAPSFAASPAPRSARPRLPSAGSPQPPATTDRTRSPSPTPGRTGGGRILTGWEITVYYTAVERFHSGDPTEVTGCPRLDCAHGDADLGVYPGSFVRAVKDEGTGLTAEGRYLNWSYDVGYWLDTVPRSSDGGTLTPFVSAAADPGVLAQGTRFAVAACGRQEDGSPAAAAVCTALRDAAWRITDEFTPGLGGEKHIDAYIGPETGPGFTDSDWYITLIDADLRVR